MEDEEFNILVNHYILMWSSMKKDQDLWQKFLETLKTHGYQLSFTNLS